MSLSLTARFSFTLNNPGDVLLQFEAAQLPEQRVLSGNTLLGQAEHIARVPAHDGIGERIWLRTVGTFHVDYTAEVEVLRKVPDLAALPAVPPHNLPGTAVSYLFDSRYCQADRLQGFVNSRFGAHSGGARIMAMRDWIESEFLYEPGTSTSDTTARDTLAERRGICRDYAHVLIALARASAIPARYVSCYAPGVDPQDFHAVAEVFLADPQNPQGGAWYLVDPTGMADPARTAKIGIGRDAADVSFMTVFGQADYGDHDVRAVEIDR